jgi:archaellum component FlaC
MKTVNLTEESYKKLINEIGYGNDDLENLCYELKYSISDASQVIRDHMVMCDRLNQEPNQCVVEIGKHIDEIKKLLEQI